MLFLGKLLLFTLITWQLFSIKELLILMPVFYLIFLSMRELSNRTEFTIKKSLLFCTLSCFVLVIYLFKEYWGYRYTSFQHFHALETRHCFWPAVFFILFLPFCGYETNDSNFLRDLEFWTSLNTFENWFYWPFKVTGEMSFQQIHMRDRPRAWWDKLYDDEHLTTYISLIPTEPEVTGPFFSNYGTFLVSNYFDALNLTFIALVVFLAPLCIFWLWQDTETINQQIFLFLFLFLLLGMLGAFASVDFFFFFFFFECLLIPMFIILGTYGARFRRLKASYYLVYYTLIGSVLLFTVICLIITEYGTTHLTILQDVSISNKKQAIFWILLFFGFSVKIPVFPVHIWLPEAHVEAPTIGSVILAAFLLKLGGYGLIRWVFSVFTYGSYYFMPFIVVLSLLGINYCALTALRQVDLKKMIAYSSVSHMNLGILGIFSFSYQGLQGAIFLMIAHGVVSAALFFLIGALYDRYHSKALHYYGGLTTVLPVFSVFLILFSIANFSFPGSPNFIAEILILLGILKNNFLIFFFSCFGVFLSTCFSILLVNKLVFGTLKSTCIKKTQDLNRRETFVLSVLAFYGLFLGLWPQPLLDLTTFYCKITTLKILV